MSGGLSSELCLETVGGAAHQLLPRINRPIWRVPRTSSPFSWTEAWRRVAVQLRGGVFVWYGAPDVGAEEARARRNSRGAALVLGYCADHAACRAGVLR
jgi:hypothetical protein